MTKYVSDSSNFGADGPFFRIIREGLEGLVDGEDYFDLLADDVVFEYVISVPGYPRRVAGRQNIIDLYRGYGDFMTVRSADNLRVYRDREASVVVLEYEVHGESAQTGRPYDNRFVSIVTVKDGKIVQMGTTHLSPSLKRQGGPAPRPDRRCHGVIMWRNRVGMAGEQGVPGTTKGASFGRTVRRAHRLTEAGVRLTDRLLYLTRA